MVLQGCSKAANRLVSAVIAGVALVSAQSLAVGPEIKKDKFPNYFPAHTVIKCPYIPPNLTEIPTCGDQKATCVGTESHDLILGGEDNDVIVAGGGNDVVHSDALDDIVCGGPGDDTLFGARGSDTLYGGPGDDWLFGAAVAPDSLYGGEGDFDVLWGGPSMDHLHGSAGTHDTCLLQWSLGTYDPQGCNTAIRVEDVCTPASLEAAAVLEMEAHE